MSQYDDFPIDSTRYDDTVRVYGGERSSSRRTCEKTLRHFGSAVGTCTKSYLRQAQTADEEIGVQSGINYWHLEGGARASIFLGHCLIP
jgi:hypothetical protein